MDYPLPQDFIAALGQTFDSKAGSTIEEPSGIVWGDAHRLELPDFTSTIHWKRPSNVWMI